ncbi:hypothetical protein ABW18_20360 [Gordonia jacobaea]|uniref:Integral membrane protein n=2 Tax=Gordonia jacobaea TaxID=122202 RepID=A0ABR5I779_9ACTN|nr:hypothetical protein ABW18_20360 [Gordonia jacobaea]
MAAAAVRDRKGPVAELTSGTMHAESRVVRTTYSARREVGQFPFMADDDRAPEPFVLLTHGVSGTESAVILDSARVVEVPGEGFKGVFTTYPERPAHVRRPRNRVAYRWGNMTSGMAIQAIWALFGPFALVNVAGWMYPKAAQDNPIAQSCVVVLRALLRLLGLALTVTMIAQLTFLIDGVLFRRMHDGAWRDWAVLGCLVAIFLVGGFVSLYGDNDKDVDAPTDSAPTDSVPTDSVPADSAPTNPARFNESPSATDPAEVPLIATDAFVSPSDGRATVLITTHAVAGICTATIVLGDHTVPRVIWGLVVAMLAAVVVATALCVDPRATSTPEPWTKAFVSWPAVLWVVASSTLLVVTNFAAKPQHIVGDAITWLFWLDAALVGAAILATVGALVLPHNLKTWWGAREEPSTPWLNGLHAPLVAAIGVLWGVGLGVGFTRLAALVIDHNKPDHENPVPLPDSYASTAWMWGVTVLIWGLVTAAFLGGVIVVDGRARAKLAGPQLADLKLLDTSPRRSFGRRIRWGVASAKLRIPVCVGTLALCAMIAGIVATASTSLVRRGEGLQWVGIGALGLVGLLLLRAMFNAAQKPRKAGRSLGVLWDLASFWPREAHPLVPPAYAPRAIRDLERFLSTRPHRRLILAAHSQGSMIMYALAYRITREQGPERTRLSLLTYGSQLGWAYGRAFPAALSHNTHATLRRALGGRWINLVRFTDYIGDGVVSYTEGGELKRYDNGSVVPQEVFSGCYLVRENGRIVEAWLPDPSPDDYPHDAVHQHSAYTSDITWDVWIKKLDPGPGA